MSDRKEIELRRRLELAERLLVESQQSRIKLEREFNKTSQTLRCQLSDLQNSTIWKMTAVIRVPLSKLTLITKKLLRERDRRPSPGIPQNQPRKYSQPAIIEDNVPAIERPAGSLAVHLHAYYPELVPEICSYLQNVPSGFTLFVTSDTNKKLSSIEKHISTLKVRKYELIKMQNRGRDLAPLFVGLGSTLLDFDYVIHLHTKKSPHDALLAGWRKYLLDAMLGSTNLVNGILQQFERDSRLGLMSPVPFLPVKRLMKIGGDYLDMCCLLDRMGENPAALDDIPKCEFPPGSMFYIRSSALRQILHLDLDWEDFPSEDGQTDGALAHALERLLPYIVGRQGLHARTYVPRTLYCQGAVGARPLTLEAFVESIGVAPNWVLVVDHNLGGGSSLAMERFIQSGLRSNHRYVRLSFLAEGSTWILETIEASDGTVFAEKDLTEIFRCLAEAQFERIVVNSLVTSPDVEEVINQLIEFASSKDIPLEYKVHDFHAICPSPHLMDHEEKYCGIPNDLTTCDRCLPLNRRAMREQRPDLDIRRWREAFSKLLRAADSVIVFDESSCELLQKVYGPQLGGLVVEPHRPPPVYHRRALKHGPLRIGVIGTLTTAKGARCVNELASYVKELRPPVPIIVIGRCTQKIDKSIIVHGEYAREDIPHLIELHRITAVFFSSAVPETFSFVLSEVMALDLPVVAFDIGAQGRRVSTYHRGRVVPLDAPQADVLSALTEVWKQGQQACADK
jgi:glycosyltransferase involved in cell wall biosynthesis